jgi:uncharacterized protein YcbK (DUF882 family)
MVAATFVLITAPSASAETRTLKLYYTHTREKAEITFKKNGRYVQSGLNQLNKFLRDWRRNEPTKMDPRLFDLVWEVYRATGGRDYIHVVSAYRSPATNSMLRKRGRGVADKSQHMLGKAMDFYVPGVKLSALRNAALRVQGGGVGYYPTSGSPFVHLDVGNVRHWPRMSRKELVAVFPKGNTLHVPTDGKPLPGYDQALNSYKKRRGAAISIASAEPTKRSGGFLASLFGGGADEEEESGATFGMEAPQVARATPKPPKGVDAAPDQAETVRAAPEPAAPTVEEPLPETPQTIIAALPARDLPLPIAVPRPSADVTAAGPTVALAAAEEAQQAGEGEPVQELAYDVPIPMQRPKYTVNSTGMAAVSPTDLPTATAIAAAARPGAGEQAISDIIAASETGPDVPLPGTPPARGAPVVLASLQAGGSIMSPDASQASIGKGTRLAAAGGKPASMRDALIVDGADPIATLAAGARTTAKGARPSRQDSRPDPRPVVVPIENEVARWAMQSGHQTRLSPKPDGRAFAFNTIKSAPTTVYTAGFQSGARAPDASRFTGKAVTFLSVAKFSTN